MGLKDKILFLDVDGVLNCTSRWKGPNADQLDADCLCNLKYIVDNTNCSIVISSTWRLFKPGCNGLIKVLNDLNIKVVGKTSILNTLRSTEIRLWINKHNPNSFAIVDDDDGAGVGFSDKFFKTSIDTGLTLDISKNIIVCLNQ